ncbi:hypothetical protein CRUP_031948 [Coryphaenoides rupestris]|nr:hypothetical protein CRUP_031948 [Coryphaenoides rupestris]
MDTVHDGRQFMKFIDPKLGVPLPERDYGGNCLLYDPGNSTDPFHNVWDKMDGFVPAHFLGWYIKTLMIRDWWMCMIISVMFEFLEYSLEHQLPNFSECWWDHFLLAELNTFYLKFVLWMPPEHYLVLLRLVFFVNVGGVAMREIYDFMDDPSFHKKLGQQAWLVAAITVTEFLIVVKYDPNTIMLPIPFFVTQCWFLGIFLILSWTLWRFFIRDITLRYKETRRRQQERPLGNGSASSSGGGGGGPSGRSRLNGSWDSASVRQRRS